MPGVETVWGGGVPLGGTPTSIALDFSETFSNFSIRLFRLAIKATDDGSGRELQDESKGERVRVCV